MKTDKTKKKGAAREPNQEEKGPFQKEDMTTQSPAESATNTAVEPPSGLSGLPDEVVSGSGERKG
jgi:hypothetical protein